MAMKGYHKTATVLEQFLLIVFDYCRGGVQEHQLVGVLLVRTKQQPPKL